MIRRLIRSYRNLRAYPRQTIEMMTSLSASVAELQLQKVAATNNDASLDNIQREVASLCDDVTRHLVDVMAHAAATADKAERLLHELAELRAEFREQLRAMEHRQAVASDAHGAAMARTVEALRDQTKTVARVDRIVSSQARLFPSVIWAHQTGLEVRDTLRLLTPVAVVGHEKVRVGRDHDGGYVMLDDFAGVACALSLGISDDVSWDLDIARRNIRVLQFDPTVAASPQADPLFHFEPLRITPQDGPGGISIETILRSRVEGDGAMLLKIDIEGAEWVVLDAIEPSSLERFTQIVCEFHELDRLDQADFRARASRVLAKLDRSHAVVHVHGNNCSNFSNVGNTMVPQSLEVTYASRSGREFTEEAGSFPTPLDQPNEPGRADLFLDRFHFA